MATVAFRTSDTVRVQHTPLLVVKKETEPSERFLLDDPLTQQ